MVCGMPIIASAQGETQRVIDEAECGISTKIGDEQALADAICNMKSKNIANIRENAKQYFKTHFEKKLLMDKMEKLLLDES